MKREHQINLFHDLGLSYLYLRPRSMKTLIQETAEKLYNSFLVGKKRTTREVASFIDAICRGRFSYMDCTQMINDEFGKRTNYRVDRALEVHNSQFPRLELILVYSSSASGVFWGIDKTRK